MTTDAETTDAAILLDKNDIRRVQGRLLLASFLGYLAGIPFSLALASQAQSSRPSPEKIAESLLNSIVAGLLVSWVAIAIGFRTGRPCGLARLMIQTPSHNSGPHGSVCRTVFLAASLGVCSSFVVIILDLVMSSNVSQTNVTLPAPWRGFLVAIRAGINEEILCRLGLMSVLAWLMTRFISRRQTAGPAIIWPANLLAALGFAALHLPQVEALYGLTLPIIFLVIVGNGVPGLVFGWLYWKRGLIAAMIAHFSADVVIYAIVPMLE